jgi:hypothetical protein
MALEGRVDSDAGPISRVLSPTSNSRTADGCGCQKKYSTHAKLGARWGNLGATIRPFSVRHRRSGTSRRGHPDAAQLWGEREVLQPARNVYSLFFAPSRVRYHESCGGRAARVSARRSALRSYGLVCYQREREVSAHSRQFQAMRQTGGSVAAAHGPHSSATATSATQSSTSFCGCFYFHHLFFLILWTMWDSVRKRTEANMRDLFISLLDSESD